MGFDLSIEMAQINPTVGDVDGNAGIILKHIQNCKSDLIVFPELSVCGYPPEDLVLKPSFVQSCMEQVLMQVHKTHVCCALIGCSVTGVTRTAKSRVVAQGKITTNQ